MSVEQIEKEMQEFKSTLLMRRPFFGDVLLRIPIIRDDSIATACTDGRTIRWNSHFFGEMSREQRNYVLMHEVLHTLLMHPARMADYDPEIWGIASDIVVNHMCDRLARELNSLGEGAKIARPQNGVFAEIDDGCTVEALYGILKAEAEKAREGGYRIRSSYRRWGGKNSMRIRVCADGDLKPMTVNGRLMTREERKALEQEIRKMVRAAAVKDRDTSGSAWFPRELAELTKAKPIDWRAMLKEHLSEALSDDTSYATPERKYLHMDLILPGHCMSNDGELETLWAFVDSSGSIDGDTLNHFLTQLYRIVKEFHCELTICYWDTQVTDIYSKVRREKQVLLCQPKHSGGTDINCVYNWMAENHVRPDVMLILTDGYFGAVSEENRKRLRPRDTVLVISNGSENEAYSRIGKVCRLR